MTKFRYMNIICNGLWSWEQKLTAMNYENGILLVVSSEVSVNFILLFFFYNLLLNPVALVWYCGAYIFILWRLYFISLRYWIEIVLFWFSIRRMAFTEMRTALPVMKAAFIANEDGFPCFMF